MHRQKDKVFKIDFKVSCIFVLLLFSNFNFAFSSEEWNTLEDGNIYLFYCSHQDLGWENSYHNCASTRNRLMIEPAVEWAMENQEFNYCIEYSRAAMDFREYALNTPGKEYLWDNFVTLVKSGQIEIGGTYTCGYESLFYGEGLIRQVYLGRKWVRDLGGDTRVAWNVDPPVRSLQTAQIYNKAGIDYLVDSRYRKGFYRWISPNVHSGDDDYSFIVFSQGTYDHPWVYFVRDDENDPYPSSDSYGGTFYPYSFNKKMNSESSPADNVPDSTSIGLAIDYVRDYWNRNDIGQWPNDSDDSNPWAWESWSDYYQSLEGSSEGLTGVFPFYYSTDMGMPRIYMASPGEDYQGNLISDWEENSSSGDPSLQLSTAGEALDAVVERAYELGVSFEEWQGELPNSWLYIHGPSHYELISRMRSAQRLLPAAEMFTTFSAILANDFSHYPDEAFNEAWCDALFPDHGMGGVGDWYSDTYPESEGDNDVVDVASWVRVKRAEESAEELLTNATSDITGRISFTAPSDGATPIVVFNTLSWNRSDPVSCRLDERFNGNCFKIVDSDNVPVPYQILPNDDSLDIIFLADDVPSLGYKTYYAVLNESYENISQSSTIHTETEYMNDFYSVSFSPNGIESITDRNSGQTLLQTKDYSCSYYQDINLSPFELFTLRSAYDDNYLYFDAGSFPGVPPAWLDSTFAQANAHASWQYDSDKSGLLYDVYSYTSSLNDTENWWATVTQNIYFYKDIKRIDCEVILGDWGRDSEGLNHPDEVIKLREWRMALPLAFENDAAQVTYDVPMGTVLVGRDEVQSDLGAWYYYDAYDYTQMPEPPAADNTRPILPSYFHPREVQNFISASDGNHGVTMSSSVSVCDYIFPPREQDSIIPDSNFNISSPVLQPILFATRKSCGGNHGLYSQRGDHSFSFSVLSHEGNWSDNSMQGARYALQVNNPLRAVIVAENNHSTQRTLPGESFSFCNVSGENVIVSAFKKMDGDSNNIVVRIFDLLGGTGVSNTTFNFFFTASEVYQTNIIEEPIYTDNTPVLSTESNSISIDVGHHSIETFALQLESEIFN